MTEQESAYAPRLTWMGNPEATDNVKRLLTQSGTAFESRIASRCRLFANVHTDAITHVRAERVVYGRPDLGEALREVDQVVTIYQELELGSDLGIQLQLQVPIECKARQGLQVFGFEVEGS